MEDSPVNSPEQPNFADINNNQETKTTSDKSVDSPEGMGSCRLKSRLSSRIQKS